MSPILLDQGLSPHAAALLRAAGWDAVHVLDVGLDRAEDSEILKFAANERRVCITLDHDFHAHLAMTQHSGPSVVLIRAERLNSAMQAALIQKVWDVCAAEISAGAAVSVDGVSVRVRRLPFR